MRPVKMVDRTLTGVLFVLLTVLRGAGASSMARAAAPILYGQRNHESPVQAGPDDLLLIAGYGLRATDRVVYRDLGDGTKRITLPDFVPIHSTASLGTAPIVSSADTPYSLTVRMPRSAISGHCYAMWVVTEKREWSAPVLINDAKPLWVTPAFVYSTAKLAGLPQYIKVIGCNLKAPDGDLAR